MLDMLIFAYVNFLL